jgi:fructokinase
MILCCGEALIDMLPATTAAGESAFVPHAGGAVFNTAIALGRLGVPAGFLSGLSTDFFGDLLRRTLAESGVDMAHAVAADRPTTLAFVRLIDGQASYAFYDENTAGRMLTAADMPAIQRSVEALFFGGISLIAEPCGSAYEALMAREHANRVTMLDPNIRPGFISDARRHRARLERMIAMADIVKLSDEDLRWFGEEDDADSISSAWLERGPKLLVVTRGREGATAYTLRHRLTVASIPVEVADTVGAGDTFNAGLLAALAERGQLRKQAMTDLSEADLGAALALAAEAAAVTVSRAGANPPWRRELARRAV